MFLLQTKALARCISGILMCAVIIMSYQWGLLPKAHTGLWK